MFKYLAFFLGLGLTAQNLPAADSTWSGGNGNQLWNVPANWSSGVPGIDTGFFNSPDIAIFNTSTTGTVIAIDENRNIRGITFSSGASGSYTFGAEGIDQGSALHLTSGGSIVTNLGTTSTLTINAPLIIEPNTPTANASYTITNNSAAADDDPNNHKIIVNGSIRGGATTGNVTLNLTGSAGNRSNNNSGNIINGLITNGDAANLSVKVETTSNQRGAWLITNNDNDFTGNFEVSRGTLMFTSIGNAGEQSALGAGNTITLGSGVHFKYVGTTDQTTNRTFTGAGTFYNTTSNTTITITGNIQSTGYGFRGNGNFVVEGLISGTGGISRTDGGTVYLKNNNNSFSGNLAISDGAFRVDTISMNGQNSAIGNNGQILLGQSSGTTGRLEYNGVTSSNDRLIVMRNQTSSQTNITGRGVIEVMRAGETLTFQNGVRTLMDLPANISELTLRGAGNGVIEGVIGGTESNANAVVALRLIKSGTGTWTLKGANTYARETLINAGILNIQHSQALGAIMSHEAIPTAANAGTTVSSGATLQLQGNINVGQEALTLSGNGAAGQSGALVNVSGNNSFAGDITLAGNTIIGSDSGHLNLTSTATIATSGASRSLTLNGQGNGSLAASLDTNISSLTKNGTGTWNLSGNNSYTGNTTINGGVLNVTGPLGNTNVSVNNTGTFAHSGSIGGLTVANAGVVEVGNVETAFSTGSLTVNGNLTLNQTSALYMDLGSSSDVIQVNGDVTLDGFVHIRTTSGFTDGVYTLINYSGSHTDNVMTTNKIAGYDLVIDLMTANQVNLIASALTNAMYWDGSSNTANGVIDGGNGYWSNSGNNWTNSTGTANTSWDSATDLIAVFAGQSGGTVYVNDVVQVDSLQFAQNYHLEDDGGAIQINGNELEIRINGGITSQISASIIGDGGINLTGDGTLILSGYIGAHTYGGPTRVSSGTLTFDADNVLPYNNALIVGGSDGTVGISTTTGTLDLRNTSQEVGSFSVRSNSAVANQIIIGEGQTLTVNGDFSIGVPNSAKNTTNAVFSGGGSLVVNNSAGNIEFGLQTSTTVLPGMNNPADDNANRSNTSTDMRGLGSFTANAQNFRVAFGLQNASTLYLSNTYNEITAETFSVAHSNGWNAGSGTAYLGEGTNLIRANNLHLGVSKGIGTLRFVNQSAGSAGTVVIEGNNTSGLVDMIIGSNEGLNTGASPDGHLDLRGHDAFVKAGTIRLGYRSGGLTGGARGQISFSAGIFEVNTLDMGTVSGDTTATIESTLNISGGTFIVHQDFRMAAHQQSADKTGKIQARVNLTGGTLISNTDIVEVGGTNSTETNTISIINVQGGTLDMTGHSIGSDSNKINQLNLESGALKDVAEINGGDDIQKTTGGTLSLLGINTYTGNTIITAGTLQVGNGGDNGTLGNGGDVINNSILAFNRNNLLTVANRITGNGAVNQIGTGTTVISGNNDYTGLTNVQKGTLLVNNDHSGSASATGSNEVDVSSGATFGGRGRVEGNVNISSGGVLAPGGNSETVNAAVNGLESDVGTMRIMGQLNVASAAIVDMHLKTNGNHGLTPMFDSNGSKLLSVSGSSIDGGNDRIIVEGSFNLATDSIFNVSFGSDFTPSYLDTFDLIDWTGPIIPLAYYGDSSGLRVGGDADNELYSLKLPDLSAYNWFWDVSQFGSTGIIAIVPEPSRMLLFVLAFFGVVVRRKR